MLVGFYHLVYSLIHPEGRRDFRLMLPGRKDFGDLGRNVAWYLGLRGWPPRFGRFSYLEKFDYWAVFWGCFVMIGTGLGMWFPETVRLLVPSADGTLFDAFKEAHAHEAVLAVLAIAFWHVYNVHLRPDRFPGTWTWLTGRKPSGDPDQAADPLTARIPDKTVGASVR